MIQNRQKAIKYSTKMSVLFILSNLYFNTFNKLKYITWMVTNLTEP